MKENKYIEYRKWILFWGLFLDSQKEIQSMINDYNRKGWNVVQFQYVRPNFSIGRWILILLVMCITFGLVNYWVGVSIIFERVKESGGKLETSSNIKSAEPEKSSLDVSKPVEQSSVLEETVHHTNQRKIEELNTLIRQTKGSILKKYNPDISALIKSEVSDKEQALQLMHDYENITGDDLIKNLIDLSTSYDKIKSYLSVFIDLRIVDENYPHKLI